MDFARLDKKGVASLVGHGLFAFIVQREDAFLDVSNQRARMRVSALAALAGISTAAMTI
jgi:hypothetical protein